MGKALYASLLGAMLLAVTVVAPLFIYRAPSVSDVTTACIRDPAQLRAILIMYNSTISDEFRTVIDAVAPVVQRVLASTNPFQVINDEATRLSEKYWYDVARLVLSIEKAYYAAARYYHCTGDATTAAKILAEIALNKPAEEIPKNTIDQVISTLKSMDLEKEANTIKMIENALRDNDPTPISNYVESTMSYILMQELRSALVSGAK